MFRVFLWLTNVERICHQDAIAENDPVKLTEILKGNDVNAVSRPKCDSALHVAAEGNADKIAAALIDIGANVRPVFRLPLSTCSVVFALLQLPI